MKHVFNNWSELMEAFDSGLLDGKYELTRFQHEGKGPFKIQIREV